MSKALVLMTALLPTVGHSNLIKYALSYAKKVEVVISIRSFEPISGAQRYVAFVNEFRNERNVSFKLHEDDLAPQNPEDSPTFWEYWRDTIQSHTSGFGAGDYVIASEPYGYKVAEILGAKFIPYDLYREIQHVKSTHVRTNIVESFDHIMPAMKKDLMTRACLVGAESCGKTTTGKALTKVLNAYYIPEWARPYIESLGNPYPDEEIMAEVGRGQAALDRHAYYNLTDKPFIIKDTDLLATIGFYRLNDYTIPEAIYNDFEAMKSEIYFLMSSNIPFTPDPMRYGNGVRQSTDQYWINLLNEFNCNYVVVDGQTLEERTAFIYNYLMRYTHKKFKPYYSFIRD